MKTNAALVLALCLLPRLVLCQPLPIDRLTPALPTETGRQIADVASWVTSLVPVALDARASWKAPDRKRAFLLQGARIGLTYGLVFAAKKAVSRTRPCAPEACGGDRADFSFYSAHTALAFSAYGGPRPAFVIPLAVGTGGLRVAAGKHYFSDVAVGSLAGLLTSRLR